MVAAGDRRADLTPSASGTSAPARWASVSTRRRTSASPPEAAVPSERLCSLSQSSIRAKRWVRKSFCSTAWRSSELARRNFWKSPWGSITTCMNCSEDMPSSSPSSCPTSATREETIRSVPSVVSISTALAFSRVSPSPRFLGRHHSGVRRTRNRRAPSDTSSSTSGATPSAAWWERRVFTPRAPGTTP